MIHYADAPCWRLVTADGKDFDNGDGVEHFPTEKAAIRTAEAMDNWPTLVARRFDSPCAWLSCNECEEELSSDAFSAIHFVNAADADSVATQSDWTVAEDDRHFCWDCPALDEDDDEADES